MSDKLWEGFNKVDAEKDAEFYIQYLDAIRHLGDTSVYKTESLKKLQLKKGDAVLEIGCGVGHDAELLANIVGKEGKVAGIDLSEYLLAEARKRAAAKNLSIDYQQAEVYSLPFPDAAFNACRADRVFLYIDKPLIAIQEMSRVLKPGGVLYIRDPDMDTFLLDAPNLDKNIHRAFTTFFSDSFKNGIIGRQLKRLFQQAKLNNIQCEPKTLVINNYKEADAMFGIDRTIALMKNNNILAADILDAWQQNLITADRNGAFTFTLTFFAVFGHK